jgi:hypothetical protein
VKSKASNYVIFSETKYNNNNNDNDDDDDNNNNNHYHPHHHHLYFFQMVHILANTDTYRCICQNSCICQYVSTLRPKPSMTVPAKSPQDNEQNCILTTQNLMCWRWLLWKCLSCIWSMNSGPTEARANMG